MGIETHQSQNTEWNNKLNDILERLNALPKQPGPIFEVVAKGRKLRAETVFIEPLKLTQAGYGKYLKGNLSDVTYYMFIRDEDGEIIAISISSLDMSRRNRIITNPEIEVRDKGKGLATPVTSMLFSLLQYLADIHKKKIDWCVQNRNLENLETYEASPDADPAKLESMRQEQKRWLELYGSEGKFGIRDNRKIFYPQDTKTLTEIADRTHLNVSQVFQF